MADLRVTARVYCDECRRLIRLDHVPTVTTDDGLAYDLEPAFNAHAVLVHA